MSMIPVATGTGDDAQAFRDAIALAPNGGVIDAMSPANPWVINSQVIIPAAKPGIRILLGGKLGAPIGTTSAITMFKGQGAGQSIDGGTWSGITTAGCCPFELAGPQIEFTNAQIKSFYDGPKLTVAYDHRISNIDAYDMKFGSALTIGEDTVGSKVDGFNYRYSSSPITPADRASGIRIQGQGCFISHCDILAAKDGILIDPVVGKNADNILISDCFSGDCSNVGVHVTVASGAMANNVRVSGGGHGGYRACYLADGAGYVSYYSKGVEYTYANTSLAPPGRCVEADAQGLHSFDGDQIGHQNGGDQMIMGTTVNSTLILHGCHIGWPLGQAAGGGASVLIGVAGASLMAHDNFLDPGAASSGKTVYFAGPGWLDQSHNVGWIQ